jgi:hypothetical protein
MNHGVSIFSEGIILDDYCCTSDVLTLSLQKVFNVAIVFCKNVLCSANVLSLLASLKEKQSTQVISQWKTQRVYSFSAVFITYSCSRPAVARKRKSGSARIRRTEAESLK